MSKIFISIAVCALFLVSSIALEFKDCGSEGGKFTKVKVSNCDETANACVLKRHTNASIELDFALDEGVDNIEQVTTVVHGVIMGVEMPFPLQNPDACKDSGVQCPLRNGVNYEYVQTLPVLRSYPKVSVTVKWALKDIAANKTIICVYIPARIE
ncbi:NPC intracellular cholesterol transporter 2 homolog a-like [Sitodiplosis mosellana]|uniref:NPC intracellular cholesterol transporter 2 homolog a-like n=1 Tax=Sitodiplosis mosellana TaxID=263140 RepID=UPI0024437CFF|nr:NPC intracellular cholesterol transporter 2 homolog a-like [Sitodiplosis mosellana]